VRILLAEDDESVAKELSTALTRQHYLVDIAADGQTSWELAEAIKYDLILLDLMLPQVDGISFCKQRRQEGDCTPILLLTAADTSTNKVAWLDAGADDYVVKPYQLDELLARIRALLRRGSSSVSPVLEWGRVRLDASNCQVRYDGQLLHLTAKEYALLELFLRNNHRIFSQSALLDQLWSFETLPSENTVRAHIKSLRQKLKKVGAADDLIETVYGLGYRLNARDCENTQSPIQSPLSTQDRGSLKSPLNQGKAKIQNPQTQQQIPPEMIAIWERHQKKYSDRTTILEQATKALIKGTISEELRQQAQTQAHTLVGSLGSFGFAEASRLSREIEQTLKAGEKLNPTQAEYLSGLVVALQQQLGHLPLIIQPPVLQPTTLKQQSRLLIVDDDESLGHALILEATTWGIKAELATNLSQARKAIAQAQPDVVLLDLCFPDSADNGFRLLAELTTSQPPVPVLVFTATESFADRVKVARLGGWGFLQKPISPTQVMDALAQVLQKSKRPEAKLLIVDDDPHLLDVLQTLLEPWGFQLTLLDNPQRFWKTLLQSAPDLLILDLEMPELSGIDLCRIVRHDPNWSELPVLFLSVHTDAHIVQQVFTAGADDYVNKPIVEPELIARVLNRLERTQLRRKLRKLLG